MPPALAGDLRSPLRQPLRAGDVPGGWRICSRIEPAATPDDQAPVRPAVRYLQNRPDQFDCALTLAHDQRVGSGQTESSHRHVLQTRIKKAGAWLQADNLHTLCQLPTLRSNCQRDLYWLRY